MPYAKILVALVAAAGLAACASGPDAQYALLDEAGSLVSTLPATQAAGLPAGTAFRLNLNGRDQTVTLGPRMGATASAGTPIIGQTGRDGAVRLSYAGNGTGSLATGGTPYVERIDNGRPIIGHRAEPDASGRPALETTP